MTYSRGKHRLRGPQNHGKRHQQRFPIHSQFVVKQTARWTHSSDHCEQEIYSLHLSTISNHPHPTFTHRNWPISQNSKRKNAVRNNTTSQSQQEPIYGKNTYHYSISSLKRACSIILKDTLQFAPILQQKFHITLFLF